MKTTATGTARDTAPGAETPQRSGINIIGTIALLLLALGGLNWGLVGLADIDAVSMLFGRGSLAARAIHVAIAVAAVYCLVRLPRWSRAS